MSSSKGRRKRPVLSGCALLALVSTVAILWAQESPAPDLKQQENKNPEVSANELVRETVAHEVAAASDASVKHMFRSRKQNAKGSQTRLYVETNDSMAGMLIAINDQPLNSQQKQGEMDHLAW